MTEDDVALPGEDAQQMHDRLVANETPRPKQPDIVAELMEKHNVSREEAYQMIEDFGG